MIPVSVATKMRLSIFRFLFNISSLNSDSAFSTCFDVEVDRRSSFGDSSLA